MAQYSSPMAHGIMFHHFYDEVHLPGGQGAITADEFDRILCFIGIDRILSPEDWVAGFVAGNLANDDLCITFDDGLKCQFDICMPVLEAHDIRCFWFVYSSVHHGALEKFELYRRFRSKYFDDVDVFNDQFTSRFEQRSGRKIGDGQFQVYANDKLKLYPFYSTGDLKYRYLRDIVLNEVEFEEIMDSLIVERGITSVDLAAGLWLSDDHLSSLSSKGHYAGLHSYSHPISIARLSCAEQKEQYTKNYEHLRGICGRDPISMAHPSNSYDDDTIEILKNLGIACGFRSNMAICEKTGSDSDAFEIPRMDHANILRMMDTTQ